MSGGFDCKKSFQYNVIGVAGAKPPYRLSAICAVASCNGFVWLTASVHAWTRGGSPSKIAPARMPGVYAQRLYARTHTSGQTKSVQDAPTSNDHDCTDAEPTKHTQPFTEGKGFGDRDNKSEVYFKNILFLQTAARQECRAVFVTRYISLVQIAQIL